MGGGTAGGTTPKDIVPGLLGFYWEVTGKGTRTPMGTNYPLDDNGSNCPSNGINRDTVIDVKGVANQSYTINIEVRGVLGTRCYVNGKRASTAAISNDGDNNWWYEGGTYGNATGWWNSYELRVTPAVSGAPSVYYLNGSAEGTMSGGDCEREASYLVKYKASFKALGGGKITLRLHDQNCSAQQNCGSDTQGGTTCSPRTVNMTGLSVPPPANFVQPPSNQLAKLYYPQWVIFDVLSVTTP